MNEQQETASKAKPFYHYLYTLELYQERARIAFPLLVRQAEMRHPIYYSTLAEEMGISNERNLNFVLGSIGQSLILLGREWGEEIPPIQSLVINKANDLPGDGIGLFITQDTYRSMPTWEKKLIMDRYFQTIYSYQKWPEVLGAFQLAATVTDYNLILKEASRAGFGGGESQEHRDLKHHVASHPEILRLGKSSPHGTTEEPIPSGDRLDVLFRRKDQWIAVEVKSQTSSDADLARGMFQCVKYQAVMEAALKALGKPPDVRTLLVTTRELSPELISLRNRLGIEVTVIAAPAPSLDTSRARSGRHTPSFPTFPG